MKRKPQKGIFYYPMEVGHVTNKRVRLLLNDHGPEGYWIWSCIIDKAYGLNGYYFKVTGDDVELLSADICRKTPEVVWQVIESCVRRGLFDKHAFDTDNVLTNDRMQINYIKATYDRRRKGAKIYFSEKHFLITEHDLSEIGDSFLKNIFFLETGKSLLEISQLSEAGTLFSEEKTDLSSEKGTKLPGKSEFRPVKNENENENEIKTLYSLDSESGFLNSLPKGVTRVTKSKKAAAKKKKEVTPDVKLFNEMKNDWMVWFKARAKISPKFEGKEAKAVSSLRSYFKRIARESGGSDEHLEAGRLFKDVLDRWEGLKSSKFLYGCTDISKINSHINDILNLLNNGCSNSQGSNQSNVGRTIKFDKA